MAILIYYDTYEIASLISFVRKDIAKALGQSIFVQGDTFETLKGNIKDALECHFNTKEDIPGIIRLHIVHDEMFAYA